MIFVIAIGMLLLLVGVCAAIFLFAARRWGWKPALLYLLFAVSGRIVTHFALSEHNQTQQTLIPLLGAGVLMWLLPHVIRHRDLERSGAIEVDDRNDVPGE